MLYHNNLILFFTLIIENLIFLYIVNYAESCSTGCLWVVICRNSLHGRNDVLDFGLVLSRGLSWHKLGLGRICNLELNPLHQRGVQVGSF